MTDLQSLLDRQVAAGVLPGAVALVARGPDRVEVAVAGLAELDGPPMTPESLFRIASITKPLTAASVMLLLDDGVLDLADPVARWLPELGAPTVVRTPQSPIDDVVPADRPITVEDLLSFRAGWGFPSDFTFPAVQPLFGQLHQGPFPDEMPEPERWLELLAGIPLLHQPGAAWLYNTCADVLGLLVARASGSSFEDFLAERLFDPLGMADTALQVPARALPRFTALYRPGADGGLELVDPPAGRWVTPPPFPSGAGGLVSTVGDWFGFARMLLAQGVAQTGPAAGRRILSAAAVRAMTSDQLTPAQRAASPLFLDGQGWGYGGSVDVERVRPWNEPGRYGWVGGTGTSAYLHPDRGTVALLFTQRMMNDPTHPQHLQEFWRSAARSAGPDGTASQ